MTLICDKMNNHGYMAGAHHNSEWVTQAYYKSIPEAEQMQGTLDRIGKIEYHRCFHIDHNKPATPTLDNLFRTHERKGESFYDHSIHCVWREPKGKGWGPNPPECMMERTVKCNDGKEFLVPSCLTKDKAGNWHSPCDLAFWVKLYHPDSQKEGLDAIGGCWLKHPHPQWRPIYNYTDAEVVQALQIMCAQFDWEFEHKSDSEYMIIH